MIQFMKTRYLFFLAASLCLPSFLFAKGTDDGDSRKEVIEAIALANGSRGKIDRPKAFETLREYAGKGYTRAMNALGLMYINGYTPTYEADTTLAIYWLTQAGENGYSSAWCNLGTIYKYAHGGVAQNFEKAYEYYEKAALKNHPDGYYGAGYLLYKGLGCDQNYEKAFRYFGKGGEKNYTPAMYMLGLCYRNGYGTRRNEATAHYWLAGAHDRGYRFAAREIEKETPENRENRIRLGNSHMLSVPAQYAGIDHLRTSDQLPEEISGEYEGILVTYDWSGQHIIGEEPLRLILASDGQRIAGEWLEPDNDTVFLRARITDGGLIFEQTQQYRSDHYTEADQSVLFSFKEAEIRITNDREGITLNGNLRMYSPETMEPERPMYIALRRMDAMLSIKNQTGENRALKGLKAYPVPFGNDLNLAFFQEEETAVQVGIYSHTGAPLFWYEAGVLPQGERELTLSPSLPAGTYIVKVISGDRSAQVVVLSNNRKK